MTKLTTSVLILLVFSFLQIQAQLHHYNPQITAAGKGKVNTKIDNIGYWQQMIRKGYVLPNPPCIVPKAVSNGSLVHARGILPQDSPDVCVADDVSITQSENSVFINPDNDQEILNSNNSTDWNGSQVNFSFGDDVLLSEDAGENWSGSHGGAGGTNMGDPSVAINMDGQWFAANINNNYGQSVAWSDDKGITWNDIVVSTVPSPGQDILDKEMLTVDNSGTSAFMGNLYDSWTNFVSTSPDYQQIEIVHSSDHGNTWSSPICISPAVAAGSFCHGTNLQTGPNGEVYCAFSIYDTWPGDESAIGFTRSVNGGTSFTPARRIVTNISGIRTSGTNKNMRVNSFPSMTVDLSSGPDKGTIYLVWANKGVPGVNTGTSIDVYLVRSTDKGTTWSVPVKVNQDSSGPGKEHFFPWITCDPETGKICVVYYDDRNVSTVQCETWISYSQDGGQTFTDMKVSDVAFTPVPIPGLAPGYFGDYIGVTARNRMAYPVWTDNRSGNTLTWTSPVNLGPPPNQPWVVYDSYTLTNITKKGTQDMNFGDSIYLNLSLRNEGDQPASGVNAFVSSSSQYIEFTDSTEGYGDFSPGEVKVVPNGFAFRVSDTIPDELRVKFNVVATNANDSTWLSDFTIVAHAPNIIITGVTILDSLNGNNNGRFDAGEHDIVAITLQNTGHFACNSTWVKISTISDFVKFQNDSMFAGSLQPGKTATVLIPADVDPDACEFTNADLRILAGTGLYRVTMNFHQTLGMQAEDWESGGFTSYPWVMGGVADWFIDTIHYSGRYSARSGRVFNNSQSRLEVTRSVGLNDSISFYVKVSSEDGYDWLHFFIDNVPLGQWTGEMDWVRASYPVTPGVHTFRWWYVTDISYLEGSNCGWIDNIVFPPPALPEVHAGNDTSVCTGNSLQIRATAANYDSLRWSTSGDGSFSNDTALNPLYTPGPGDLYAGLARLRLRGIDPVGCNTSNLFLSIQPFPVAHVTALPDDTVCGGQEVRLRTDIIPGGHYLWTPGGFTTPGIIVDTSVTSGFGSRWFTVIVTNTYNCSASDSVRITFKDCTGLAEMGNEPSCLLFPNPNDGTFTLKLSGCRQSRINIRLINQLGQAVFEDKDVIVSGTFMRTYNPRQLLPGVYLLSAGDLRFKVVVK